MTTLQEQFWDGKFGKEYTDRNTQDTQSWDNMYLETWGVTKIEMNEKCFGFLHKDIKILEVGCNTGMQLVGLQRMGFKYIYGIELQEYAVEKAKEYTKGVNIIQGSGFDIPFKDDYFDLIVINGVHIHIAPENLKNFMSEVVRCSKKYIMGFDYYAKELTNINYRGNEGFLWKADYAKIYADYFPILKLNNQTLYPYIIEAQKGNEDAVYLLEKEKERAL